MWALVLGRVLSIPPGHRRAPLRFSSCAFQAGSPSLSVRPGLQLPRPEASSYRDHQLTPELRWVPPSREPRDRGPAGSPPSAIWVPLLSVEPLSGCCSSLSPWAGGRASTTTGGACYRRVPCGEGRETLKSVLPARHLGACLKKALLKMS
ncbi:hypothetical protein NDU88_004741 [Pleurodeles waltl]|uniref:Uncharacterized protein n=1 Tax=Pleurodeles waltl TaxID=8319 RepID=A0AAV7MX90_PLEWA|nr:hypothetical protein NDU88_004741 [Pleurodeles waltl]